MADRYEEVRNEINKKVMQLINNSVAEKLRAESITSPDRIVFKTHAITHCLFEYAFRNYKRNYPGEWGEDYKLEEISWAQFKEENVSWMANLLFGRNYETFEYDFKKAEGREPTAQDEEEAKSRYIGYIEETINKYPKEAKAYYRFLMMLEKGSPESDILFIVCDILKPD